MKAKKDYCVVIKKRNNTVIKIEVSSPARAGHLVKKHNRKKSVLSAYWVYKMPGQKYF